MGLVSNLLGGVVVESRTKSWTGNLFYSDRTFKNNRVMDERDDVASRIEFDLQSPLNELSKVPVIGIATGVSRMALAVIHTIGHTLAALVTFDKGHCYHAAKGACEFLRGSIEAIPFAGRAFSESYKDGLWWILKIYNPDAPDSLDLHTGRWSYFKQSRPSAYVMA